jgi:hypothetical protein
VIGDTSEKTTGTRGPALSTGADDDEIGADVDGNVEKLLPRSAATDERLDSRAVAVDASVRDGLRELSLER